MIHPLKTILAEYDISIELNDMLRTYTLRSTRAGEYIISRFMVQKGKDLEFDYILPALESFQRLRKAI